MSQLKISTRLALLIGALALLLVLIGGVGLYGMSKSDEALDVAYQDSTLPIAQTADIKYLMIHNSLVLTDTLLEPTPKRVADDTAEVEANIALISKTWDSYMVTPKTPEEAQLAKAYAEKRTQFVKEGLQPVVALR